MPTQDRTGTKYEKLLAFSLESIGFVRDAHAGNNYLHPLKRAEMVILETYIQPDLVVRTDETITAILYSTHWSETRSSKKKFWRTWEELAQQRVAIGNTFLSINCIFEALPSSYPPMSCRTVADLPQDASRTGVPPLQLEGWDPGNGWAMLESFDVNILFPKNYAPVEDVTTFAEGEHDPVTTGLLRKALSSTTKSHFTSQWDTLRSIRSNAPPLPRRTPDTHSRFRIGLLHVYLLCKLMRKRTSEPVSVASLVSTLTEIAASEIDVNALCSRPPFDRFPLADLNELLEVLAGVYVRKGKKPERFCKLRKFDSSTKVTFNADLRLCASDLKHHLANTAFIDSIEKAFDRFDKAYGISEVIDDLAHPASVEPKIAFARRQLLPLVGQPEALGSALVSLSSPKTKAREAVSPHNQNWHFELLLYLCGLNSSEDVQTRFKQLFEVSGHKLRPHAPYGGHAQTVAFMLQGRDVCEAWSEAGTRRTLTPDQFRELCWTTAAKCVSGAFAERHGGAKEVSIQTAVTLYLQSKSMRIISSDLNGFHILIEHYLGDLCHLRFIDEEEQEGTASAVLENCVRPSWQTEMVRALWGSSPLTTWFEGVSKSSEWLIKVQSAQDGNEGHKTKELAGRCRSMHLAWLHDKNPHSRRDWSFQLRSMPKVALVLDGDWDRPKKKNLLEAGWDWVGDVTQLDELRALISASESET